MCTSDFETDPPATRRERADLFGCGGLEVGIAPSADLEAAADPAEGLGGVGRDFRVADLALFGAFARFDPGGAMGAGEDLVSDDLLFLACGFAFHVR